MKPYLLILFLIFSTSSSFAQIFGRTYNPGAYYTNDGVKHTGLLAKDFDPPSLFSSGDNTIYFKTDSNAKREKIKVSTIKGFVVTNKDTARTDSFVSVRSIYGRIKYKYDIIQVINDNGPIKLYNYRLQRKMMGSYGVGITYGVGVTYYDNYYFFGPNADVAVEMRKKNFKDVMSEMMEDDPDTVTKIQDGTFGMGSMHDLIKYYNSRKAKAANM